MMFAVTYAAAASCTSESECSAGAVAAAFLRELRVDEALSVRVTKMLKVCRHLHGSLFLCRSRIGYPIVLCSTFI
jgi:hypothetical protein